MEIPFVGSTYELDAKSFAVQRCINLFPILAEVPNTKTVAALRGTSGLDLFTTATGGIIRGGISSTANRLFVIAGDKFTEIGTTGTETIHGSLNTFSGRVTVVENLTQIMVVDGTDGWIFTKASDTWAQISDGDFPTCEFVTYQDGYFIVAETGTQKVYISALNDGTAWDALDFTSVESSPDALTLAYSDNGNVWMFGNRSTEVYQNTGNAAFPFERISGAIIQTGCASGHTVQKFDNTIAWLGIDEQGQGVVWKADGYQARRLSTAAIEKRIDEVTDISDSYAWVYHEQGHIFYCLQINGLDTTLVYDGATGMWHERSFWNSNTGERELHRGGSHFFFNGKNLVGDRENGKIYDLDLGYYSDAGDEIIAERISPHLQDEKRLISFSSFELDMETAIGLTTGQGSDPQIMLQYSDDGGNTWSNELWMSMGKIGEYDTRVVWRQLGNARDRVWKVRISDPVFRQINGAYINNGS